MNKQTKLTLTHYFGDTTHAKAAQEYLNGRARNVWIIDGAMRNIVFALDKPVDVITLLVSDQEGYGNEDKTFDNQKYRVTYQDVGSYLRTRVFAGDGCAIHVESGIPIQIPEFNQVPPVMQVSDDVSEYTEDQLKEQFTKLADFTLAVHAKYTPKEPVEDVKTNESTAEVVEFKQPETSVGTN